MRAVWALLFILPTVLVEDVKPPQQKAKQDQVSSPVELPALPASQPVTPSPAPAVSDSPIILALDELYVIKQAKGDDPAILDDSPRGVVTVTEEVGPIRIRAKFAGGSGKVETRVYDSAKVWVIEPIKDASRNECELLVRREKAPREVFRYQIKTLVGPRPPPSPEPVPPGPTPEPSPVVTPPIEGVRLLAVWDDSKPLPTGQHSIIYGKKVREYLDRKVPEYRIWKSTTDGYADSKEFGDAMKRERKSTPWLVFSNGKTGFEGALPRTVDEMMTLLKQFYGD